MKRSLLLLCILLIGWACEEGSSSSNVLVRTPSELEQAIEDARAGDEIILANGIWQDVGIHFVGQGSEDKPITLRAETAGEVMIQGESYLKLGGKYLVVQGLHFRQGFTPTGAVIEFAVNDTLIAHHCRVSQCVITGYNQLQRNQSDLWVQFKGRHNQLDRCYLAGKSNRGPTIRVDLAGNEHIRNYHQIIHNHFGPRPPKGGPSAETI